MSENLNGRMEAIASGAQINDWLEVTKDYYNDDELLLGTMELPETLELLQAVGEITAESEDKTFLIGAVTYKIGDFFFVRKALNHMGEISERGFAAMHPLVGTVGASFCRETGSMGMFFDEELTSTFREPNFIGIATSISGPSPELHAHLLNQIDFIKTQI